jgi:hypothetical protein
MRHLTAGELVDLAEGTRAESSAPHLRSCDQCRRELVDMRAMLAVATKAVVPEPSPLFWEHLSKRVHEAVAAEGSVPRASWLSALQDWTSSRLVWLVSAGAAAAVIVAAGLALKSGAPGGSIPAPAAMESVAAADAVSDSTSPNDDPSLTLVATLAGEMDWEGNSEPELTTRVGAADKAVMDLSDGERRELERLLKEALVHRGG